MSDSSPKRTRTCVGCHTQSTKMQLVRIVRMADGSVTYDKTGRAPGRGAYVCSEQCLSASLKSKKLHRALKANIGKDDEQRIVREVHEALAKEVG